MANMAVPAVDSPRSSTPSKSGITVSKTGESVIPSSVRPDGSVRKEIRVKPGYKPPEDVEVYKNRTAEGFRNKGKTGVPGAEGVQIPEPSAATNKNAKRREARKKAAAATTKDSDDTEKLKAKVKDWNNFANGPSNSSETKVVENGAQNEEAALDPQAEMAKEARKLSKKLRQARELKDKKEQGDALLPEQFEKVIKINELIRQLDALGFNQEGEKRQNNEEEDTKKENGA